MSPTMDGAKAKKRKQKKQKSLLEGDKKQKGDDAVASSKKHKPKKNGENQNKKSLPLKSPAPNNGPNGKPKKTRGKKKGKAERGGDAEEGGRMAAAEAIVKDPRFQSVHSDPRFQRLPKRQSKVAVDARFAHMFSDERFGSSAAPVDKRGKPKKGKQENPLLRYYIQEDNGEEDSREDGSADAAGKMRRLKALQPSSSEDEESPSESSDDSSTTSYSDEEDDDEDDQDSIGSDVAHYLMANHDDTPQTEQATRRLAAVNLDWDHIKAVDLYVVMTSCVPKGGHVSSVAVYPSEFGLKCMEIEATQGPSVLIHGEGAHHYENDHDDISEGSSSDDENEDGAESDDDEQENQKLRTYELNRLRYFYAVVDCDSSTTADHLYKELDGTEVLKTSNVLDLRFIPENMEFLHPPRDIATEIPANYKEPDFHTRALQHSNVKLSWEEDEPQRKKVLKRKFNADQLDEMEFKDFLASDDDETEEDDESGGLPDGAAKKLNKGEKYLALLQSADSSGSDDDNDKDVEITFNTGLEDVAKRALEKKDKKSETVWEAYLRKRKEKKMTRKRKSKHSSEDDSDDSDYERKETNDMLDQSDDFFEESDSDGEVRMKGKKGPLKVPSKKGKKQSQQMDNELEASQAELELLCANGDHPESPRKDDGKISRKIKKKGKKQLTEDKLPKEDYHDDPRFVAMHTSYHFALDPTDPQYKRSATYARQTLQKQKDENVEDELTKTGKGKVQVPVVNVNSDDAKSNEMLLEKHRALALARSLKRKTEALKTERKDR